MFRPFVLRLCFNICRPTLAVLQLIGAAGVRFWRGASQPRCRNFRGLQGFGRFSCPPPENAIFRPLFPNVWGAPPGPPNLRQKTPPPSFTYASTCPKLLIDADRGPSSRSALSTRSTGLKTWSNRLCFVCASNIYRLKTAVLQPVPSY